MHWGDFNTSAKISVCVRVYVWAWECVNINIEVSWQHFCTPPLQLFPPPSQTCHFGLLPSVLPSHLLAGQICSFQCPKKQWNIFVPFKDNVSFVEITCCILLGVNEWHREQVSLCKTWPLVFHLCRDNCYRLRLDISPFLKCFLLSAAVMVPCTAQPAHLPVYQGVPFNSSQLFKLRSIEMVAELALQLCKKLMAGKCYCHKHVTSFLNCIFPIVICLK